MPRACCAALPAPGCSQHAEDLRAATSAFQACAEALADVIAQSGQHVSVEEAVYKLGQLEAALAHLIQEVAKEGASLAPAQQQQQRLSHSTLALHMVVSLLFTSATRLRRMVALLPEALAADAPASRIPVSRHFAASQAWDMASLTHMAHGTLGLRGASVLRQSLLSSGGGGGKGVGGGGKAAQAGPAELLAQLERPTLARVESSSKLLAAQGRGDGSSGGARGGGAQRVQHALSRAWTPAYRAARAGLCRVEATTGFTLAHLALGVQAAVSYIGTMVLVVVPEVQEALHGRAIWAVFM